MKDRSILYLLILMLAGISRATSVDAQINAYAQVTSISGTTLRLSNIDQSHGYSFTAGDQVIVIQMQDEVMGANTSNNSSFGTISSIGSAGLFETATIKSISGTKMVLTANLSKTYNTGSGAVVQVVSFNLLSSGNYTTTGTLTAAPWNGSTGGIVAFRVGGTLTLANSVSADGLGFNGGSVSSNYEVSCEPGVYDNTSSNYAYKGEGIEGSPTITYTTHTGRGPLASGGGGGSDDNGGGGGGGGYTAGGQGGQGWTCTSSNASGGLGGLGLGSYISAGRLFMGGGGGGGQQNNGVGSAGASGGGIVFVKANTLATSCSGSVSISASGLTAPNSGNDGSGGAGGGGSVVISVNSYAVSSGCPLNVVSNGGNGGNVTDPNSHGGGGGGGQGAIIYSGALPSPATHITSTANNGTGGLNSGSSGASSAGNGAGTNNSGIMSGVPILLPVDFLAFSASKNGQEDVLSWTTGQLSGHVQFVAQRSADGIAFQDIGTVDGVVNGQSQGSYVFADKEPLSGKNFYRVKMVAVDGAEKYTPVCIVDWTDAAAAFRIYPNPAGPVFTIQLPRTPTGTVAVSIEDMAGATVMRDVLTASAGKVVIRLNRALPTGLYLVRVVAGKDVETGKVLFRP